MRRPHLLNADIEPWCFQVEAYPGESFGHFLARFRRANTVTSKGLAAVLGLSPVLVARWEIPSMSQSPAEEHLTALSNLTGVAVQGLRAMLPPGRSQMYLGTRLCGVCYAETGAHLVAWQIEAQPFCERHGLKLLLACPKCGTGFPTPARWELGVCESCLLAFAEMGACQKLRQEVVPAVLLQEPPLAKKRPGRPRRC